MMSNTIVACPPVRIRLRQPPLDSSENEQRGAEGDRVASRLIEPEKSNEEPKATELRTVLRREQRGAEGDIVASRLMELKKEQRGAEGDRVASLSRTEKE